MSEELNTRVQMTVRGANMMTVPIDDTLSVAGEAADAKAVGDALALKADLSAVVTISVDGQEADNQGVILLDAGDIPLEEGSATSVKAAVDAVSARTAEDIPMSADPEAQSIADALAASVTKTADQIAMSAEDSTNVRDRIEALEAGTAGVVKSVNNETADENGNVLLNRVPYADNLLSSGSQSSDGVFLIRATGGDASISNGDARISSIIGRAEHDGYVAEVLTAVTNNDDLEAQIDRSVFITVVDEDATITLTYTDAWSTDPATYGITVTGTPVSGNTITITYVKEIRGTITVSDPQAFVSTGWNLFNRTAGYAKVPKYSDTYGFRVDGSYTGISWSATEDGTRTVIQVDNHRFDIPDDGYIFVTGGDATTEIFMTWSDWTAQANGGVHENYTQSVINLAGIMSGAFPDGLMAVGDVADEINFSDRRTYSRIEKLGYSEEARQEAEETGRPFDFDEDFIYIVRETVVETQLSEGAGKYTANGHGVEMFTETAVAPDVRIVYSNDLKNKLERDVLTISQQSLTAKQQRQVRTNTGAIGMSDLNGMFKKVTFSKAYSIQANGSVTITRSELGYAAPEGYTFLAMCGFDTHSASVVPARVHLTSNASIVLVNISGSTKSSTLYVQYAFVKSNFI